MVVKVKKNSAKVLVILLGIVGLALVANSRISHQGNANILAGCGSGGIYACPPVGVDVPKLPKTPKCPCPTPKLPQG